MVTTALSSENFKNLISSLEERVQTGRGQCDAHVKRSVLKILLVLAIHQRKYKLKTAQLVVGLHKQKYFRKGQENGLSINKIKFWQNTPEIQKRNRKKGKRGAMKKQGEGLCWGDMCSVEGGGPGTGNGRSRRGRGGERTPPVPILHTMGVTGGEG